MEKALTQFSGGIWCFNPMLNDATKAHTEKSSDQQGVKP